MASSIYRQFFWRTVKGDLETILAASLERWGDKGRARYAALMATAFRTIADNPRSPTTRARDELIANVRSFHVRHARPKHGVRTPVHVIFYRAIDHDVIEIVRALHERMDPVRHVDEPEPTTKRRRRP